MNYVPQTLYAVVSLVGRVLLIAGARLVYLWFMALAAHFRCIINKPLNLETIVTFRTVGLQTPKCRYVRNAWCAGSRAVVATYSNNDLRLPFLSLLR